MKRSPIRSKIEQEILELSPTVEAKWTRDSFPRIAYIDKRANGHYRMKIIAPEPTDDQIERIKRLPHVTKVGYTHAGIISFGLRPSMGITIHFDCRPSDIKL